MYALSRLLAVVVTAGLARAHTVITYPGWRGNNLHTNGTPPELNPGSIGIDHYENGTTGFPYGMQWMYPCGGMPVTTNRTKWPVNGGAVAVQPGWFPGHSSAVIYINIGINAPGQDAPPNMSHPAVPPFAISGPNNTYYQGEFCIPQVGMPANLSLQIGDNITIQVIELAQHGAALYSCVDVTLADPSEVEQVTADNCKNDSWIGMELVFTTKALTGSAPSPIRRPPAWLATTAILAFTVSLL